MVGGGSGRKRVKKGGAGNVDLFLGYKNEGIKFSAMLILGV